MDQMGEPDKVKLRAEIQDNGWNIECRVSDNWWAHEFWGLTSSWRPVGARIFVTFLVDPMERSNDIASVWAIAVSSEMPADRIAAERTAISVSPRWPERMREIIGKVNSLRPG